MNTTDRSHAPVCAITGSGGYVGGCIKTYFAANGWKILELTRQPTPNSHAIKFLLGDEISPSSLAGVDCFVHCAYDFKPVHWDEIRTVNVAGSRTIIEAACAAKIPKIVFISSISAFDHCRSLYGKAKVEIEKIALDTGAMVVRPGLVYGCGAGGMFGKLVAQIRNLSLIPLIGDGSQNQFLVHNEDLSAFIEKYAAGGIQVTPRILTVAHAQPWPFKKLLQEIAAVLGKRVRFTPLPWRLLWIGLKSAELFGLRLEFRSDSLISLMYQNPKPDFSENSKVGLICRPFEAKKLKF